MTQTRIYYEDISIMKQINQWILFAFLILSIPAVAQKKPTKKPAAQKQSVTKPTPQKVADTAADEKKVRDIIAFLEYMMNMLGSSSTPVRDKEVLITESYSKIFRDSKVQIEDDLDDERKVITNKDIVAYLKDVNFFFHDVRFEFTIESIQASTLPGGEHYYKVTTTRNLKGTTVDQKTVNNSQPRYLEINYNPKDQDLKIVSMYTNEFDEKKALTSWWNELSFEWQSILKKQLAISADSVNLADIKRITSIKQLDISNNTYVQTLDPLTQLYGLASLNISGTKISDLAPIRNLTELVDLNLSNTEIHDLSTLKYASKLERLVINNTQVTNVASLEKMIDLQSLEMRGTAVTDFSPLSNLVQLQQVDLTGTQISNLDAFENLTQLIELNVSNSMVKDLKPLKNLNNLQLLDLDSTRVSELQDLSGLDNLKILHASYSSISNLSPLLKLTRLEKIYCDQTPITKEAANQFMTANPKVLVIFDSKDLKAWWDSLPIAWQTTFSKAAHIADQPSKEDLAKIPLLDSLNLEGQIRMNDLSPINKLQRVRTLVISKTSITDLSPLRAHVEIQYLDISETEVSDVSVIRHLPALKMLKADKSKIKNVGALVAPNLNRFYADQTDINDEDAAEFLTKNPDCLMIYKTATLNAWWSNLSESWKTGFKEHAKFGLPVTREHLHQLVEMEALHCKDIAITNLSPLSEFIRLKELHLSGTSMSALTPIKNIKSLRSLHASNSPIAKLDSLDQLTELEELDISNTPVDDIYAVWKLSKLKKLNCSGTQIKRLDVLEKLEALEYLDCSNTNVSKLDALDYLSLKTLKCYNTKVSTRAIENFKASHPDCSVIYYR